MSKSVEERVVEMRFDNRQFERNVQSTMSTLDGLKRSLKLDGAAKGFENIDKAANSVSLNGIAAGVEALQKRFSTFGIMGMRVIENLTDSLMKFANKTMGFVTDSIVSGGKRRAMNIENAHFQLQALLKDEAKVQAVMADAMESVDGTAYAYDEAAKAASQFAASGIQAGDDMLGALKGITGVAAMTNSSFEDISRVFTTVAGNGRLMGDQLLQLSSRGLNAASTLADYFKEVRGQADMTEGTIREMVSDGEISFKDFADAMTWAFGDSAKRANETFTGAFSNMKSALARIGAGFFSPFVEQNGEMVQLLNALRVQINNVKSALVFDEQKSAISGLTKESRLMVETVSQFAKDGSMGFDQFTSAILGTSKTEKELVSINEKLSESYEKVKETGAAGSDILNEFGENGVNASEAVLNYMNGVTEGSVRATSEVRNAVKELTGGVKIAAGDVARLAEEGKISCDIFTNAVVNASGAISRESKLASDAVQKMMGKVKENGSVTKDTLIEFGRNGINAITAVEKYINGVADGSIRASYATKTAIGDIAQGTKVMAGDIIKLAEEGKISYDIFQSAMENTYGDDKKKLSKQFTDVVLDNIKKITHAIENADLTKHFEVFYNVVDTAKNVLSGVVSFLKPIGQGFRDIFPPVSVNAIAEFTAKLKELTANFKMNEKDAANLRSTFKGLFAVLHIVGSAISTLVKAVFPMTKGFDGIGSSILSVTGAIGEWLASLDQAIKKNDAFNKAVQKVHDTVAPVFQSIGDHINGAVTAIKDFAHTHFSVPDTSEFMSFSDKLKTRLEPFKKIGEVAKAAVERLTEVFKAAAPVLSKLGGMIVDTLGKICDGIVKALHGEGFDSLIDLLNGGMLVGIGTGLMKFIENVQANINKAGGMFSGVNRILFNVKNTLISYQAGLKADVLLKIAGAIAVLAGALLVLSFIDSDKLGGAIAAISILFGELATSMSVFDKTLNKGSVLKLSAVGVTMIEMSAAILILASALKKISSIDSDRLAGALVGITVLMGEMTAASLALSKWGGKIKTSAVSMILFAEAINVLTQAVGKLGELDPDKLTRGLVGVGVLMGELAAFMVAAKFGNFKMTQGLAIIELAGALLILEKSVSGFGKMDIEVLKQGLAGVGAVLAEVAVFSVIAGLGKHVISSAVALTIVGAAMLIFSKAVKDIGTLPVDTIEKGLLGIGGALYSTAIAVKLMPKNMIGIGLGLIEVAAALKIIGGIIKETGEMRWETISNGLFVLASSLTVLAIAMNAMKGTLGAASAMLVISAALAVFTPILKTLGSLSMEEIGKALLTLSGAFTVLGIAGAVLGPMIPAILGLSGALALLGVAVAACGVGLLAFSAGLTSLAASGVVNAAALVATLEILIVGILGVIANSATAISNAVKAIIFAVVDVVAECAPVIAKGILTVVDEIAKSLTLYIPSIVASLMEFLIGVINAISERLPELIDAAVHLIGTFFRGVVNALKGIDTTALMEGVIGVGLLSALMIALSAVSGMIPGAMAGVLGMGVVLAELSLVLAAVGVFAHLPGLEWLIGKGGDFLQSVGTAIGKFAGGIAGGFLGGMSSQFPQIGQDLTDFMVNVQGFIEGAEKIDPAMLQGVNALAETILLLSAANILDGIAKWFTGGSSLVKFGEELAEFGPYFKKYSSEVAGIDSEVVTASANAALALAEMASKLPNSGGLAGKIFGENKLSDFGAELEKFAPYIKKYGDEVNGLDSEAVKASAEAAQIMADMASKLPNSGGLAAKIFGDNTLSAFGEELEKFAPYIAGYAREVNGIVPEAVKASVQAAQMLSDMAVTLPNSGGLSAKIFGDNTLSAFGEELEKFGPCIARYSENVANVNPAVVTASANAAKALAELANNLPDTGGLAGLFTGDSDIGKFGQSLEKFGQAFSGYYNSVSNIETDLLAAVIVELGKLVELAGAMSGIDPSGMTQFAGNLTAMGNNGIDGFIQTFANANEKVQRSVTELLTQVTFIMQELIKGMNAKRELLLATAGNICVALVAKFRLGLLTDVFFTLGGNIVQALANGIKNRQGSAETTAKTVCATVINAFRSNLSAESLRGIGANAAQGLADGIRSKVDEIANAAIDAAKRAIDAARRELDEHSPSRVFFEIGENVDQGMVNGIRAYLGRVSAAGADLGKETIDSMKSAIRHVSDAVNGAIDTEPTIRPVLDISNIQNGVGEINSLFSKGFDMSVSYDMAHMAVKNRKFGSDVVDSAGYGSQQSVINNFKLEQNNYSPKALSRKDIYRQTRNQFAIMKEVVSSI